jgi:hypothetical protein
MFLHKSNSFLEIIGIPFSSVTAIRPSAKPSTNSHVLLWLDRRSSFTQNDALSISTFSQVAPEPADTGDPFGVIVVFDFLLMVLLCCGVPSRGRQILVVRRVRDQIRGRGRSIRCVAHIKFKTWAV